jgi:hypothetical protein
MSSTCGHPRVRIDARWLDNALLGGMAGVFLVNALVALLQPGTVTGLVERSALGRAVPAMAGSWLAVAIGLNDLLLGLALGLSLRLSRFRTHVLAWAGVWLLAVTVLELSSLHAPGG